MIQIIATPNDLQNLGENTKENILIWIPISQNFNEFANQEISAFYIYDIATAQDYLIGIEHNDISKNNISDICHIFNSHRKIIYRKMFFSKIPFGKSMDMELVLWMITGDSMSTNFKDNSKKILKIYGKIIDTIPDINNNVPIMQFIDSCRDIRNEMLVNIANLKSIQGLDFYSNIIMKELQVLESNGICVDVVAFEKFFEVKSSKMQYSKYNIFTKTGRPSNINDKVNFAALNKSTGVRSIVISRFEKGKLIEFDYESHHFRLMAKLLNYNFQSGNIHEYFGKIYFSTDSLTEEQYAQSKQISFRQLYGETEKEFSTLEFFKGVQEYKELLWHAYNINGYIETPIAKKRIYKKHYTKMNLNKLFNYLLQAYETEHNVLVISKINKILENKNTKLILYTYDSFLLDFDLTDGKQIILDIKKIVEEDGMISNVKVGNNYNEMHVLNI
jgi:hypothetical protein